MSIFFINMYLGSLLTLMEHLWFHIKHDKKYFEERKNLLFRNYFAWSFFVFFSWTDWLIEWTRAERRRWQQKKKQQPVQMCSHIFNYNGNHRFHQSLVRCSRLFFSSFHFQYSISIYQEGQWKWTRIIYSNINVSHFMNR